MLVLVGIHFSSKAQSVCNCWIMRDSSFHTVPFAYDSDNTGLDSVPAPPLYINDDGSTKAIKLPFHFCFWGTSIDSVYINNNGNISFGQAYSSFVPVGFPSHNYMMIAPFWSDVDTRDTFAGTKSGVVYYKLTPHYLVVQWDSVGYFAEHNDKLNTFQVIMSDGAGAIIPSGANVEFCYKTMQWTTGDASGGNFGFGGSPSTVGANKGDSINYIQFGLFDTSGTLYSGQYPTIAPYDGVAWLNDKSFIFNTCPNTIPPILAGISTCDTLIACIGDTLDLALSYLSSNSSDSAHSALLPAYVPGVSIITNSPGNTDSLVLQVIASTTNYGYHTIRICGYNNEHPADTTFTTVVLQVDSAQTGHLNVSADTICFGDSVRLIAVTGSHELVWSTGQKTDTITVKPANNSIYSVQIGEGPCALTLSKNIVVNKIPTVTIKKDTICNGDIDTLVASNGLSYKWNTGQTTDTLILKPGKDTTYWVVANNKCHVDTLKSHIAVIKIPAVTITPNKQICAGESVTLIATGGGTYRWSNDSTTPSITVTPSATTTYSVLVSDGCLDSAVTIVNVNTVWITACCDTSIFPGKSVDINAASSGNYIWSPAAGLSCTNCYNPVATPDSTTIYTVATTDSAGCRASKEVEIRIKCVDFSVPNVFTPNGDGSNDVFMVNVYGVETYNIEIFDRWGIMVYRSDTPDTPWSGKNMDGNDVKDGVYYYIIKSSCGVKQMDKRGFIQLIR